MSGETLDVIGEIFWYLIFLAPIICVAICWNFMSNRKFVRVITGIFIGLLVSILCYFISLAILFRDGLGPT